MERPYSYNHDAHTYQVKVKDSKDAIALLEKHKDIMDDFEVKKGSRDDVFLNVTGIKQIRRLIIMKRNESYSSQWRAFYPWFVVIS